MFPVSAYQGIYNAQKAHPLHIAQPPQKTETLPSVRGYGLCAASVTPSVVQCHLTTFSFTPGHTLSYATLDSDRHSQPRYVISIGRWILIWIIAYERPWHYTVGYWHDGRRVPLRYGLSSHTVDDPCFVRLSNNSFTVASPSGAPRALNDVWSQNYTALRSLDQKPPASLDY